MNYTIVSQMYKYQNPIKLLLTNQLYPPANKFSQLHNNSNTLYCKKTANPLIPY